MKYNVNITYEVSVWVVIEQPKARTPFWCVKFVRLKITNEPPRVKTNTTTVRQAKTQISLGIRPVWSESSLCARSVVKDPSFLHADSEDSDQTGPIPRLIRVFVWHICHSVGFDMKRLEYGASRLTGLVYCRQHWWLNHSTSSSHQRTGN